MKQLLTKCDGCFFKTPCGCALKKNINETPEGVRYTYGFCKDKRTKGWFNYSKWLVNRELDKENTNVSVILPLFSKHDFKFFEDSLRHYLEYDRIKFEPVVISSINDPSYTEKIFNILKSIKTKANFNDYMDDEVELDDKNILQYSMNFVNTSWALISYNGVVNYIELDQAHRYLSSNENFANIYGKDFTLVNKSAFENLKGDVGDTWINKIKKFDNFTDVAIRI